MATEIVELLCPTCGNSRNELKHNTSFGGEFSCKQCGTTSVVVMDLQLHRRKEGELVCGHCGRVTNGQSRFCQCGQALKQPCVKCRKDVATEHRICDFCGWPQNLDPLSERGQQREIDAELAILGEKLASEHSKLRNEAFEAICRLGGKAAPLVSQLLAVPDEYFCAVFEAIGKIGPKAREAIPVLQQKWKARLKSDRGHQSTATMVYWETLLAIGGGPHPVGVDLLAMLPQLPSMAWGYAAASLKIVGPEHCPTAADYFVEIVLRTPSMRDEDRDDGVGTFGIPYLVRLQALDALKCLRESALPALKRAVARWFLGDVRDELRRCIDAIEKNLERAREKE